jgi:hypothetical protein
MKDATATRSAAAAQKTYGTRTSWLRGLLQDVSVAACFLRVQYMPHATYES